MSDEEATTLVVSSAHISDNEAYINTLCVRDLRTAMRMYQQLSVDELFPEDDRNYFAIQARLAERRLGAFDPSKKVMEVFDPADRLDNRVLLSWYVQSPCARCPNAHTDGVYLASNGQLFCKQDRVRKASTFIPTKIDDCLLFRDMKRFFESQRGALLIDHFSYAEPSTAYLFPFLRDSQ